MEVIVQEAIAESNLERRGDMEHREDIEWLDRCKAQPEKYKIFVDNDDVFVCDITTDEDSEPVYDFSEYGYEFALQLLRYIGCNADMV